MKENPQNVYQEINSQISFQEIHESQVFILEQQKMSMFSQESLDNQHQIILAQNNIILFDEIQSEQDKHCSNELPNLMLKKPRKKRKQQFNCDNKRKRRSSKKQISKIKGINTFSFQDDKAILLYVLQFGPKFMKIIKFFPTKTISMIKNRYYKFLGYRWDSVLGESYGYLNQQEHQIKEGNQNNGKEETQSFRNQEFNNQYLFQSFDL
ncbi:unnamed protein product [Paramecium sonneborni]|uniref:Myb-like domain-containing protein n=1 Tax=Paramecium sonneborni TaxID=65129 RepID=A0A8S1JX58_9CILI|nr:unnamed protein product [Paramecium sonneborni]CAD8047093.1 unnamed protein product [Paramecium sonneborni]